MNHNSLAKSFWGMFVLFLLTAIIGCSSISVSIDYDPQADFTN